MDTSEPTPAASSPAGSTTRICRRSSAVASTSMTAPTRGEPKMNGDRREAAGRRDDREDLVGCVAAQQADGEDAEPRAEGDERRLGPRTTPRPTVASAASRTPGSSIGWVTEVFRPPTACDRRCPGGGRSPGR